MFELPARLNELYWPMATFPVAFEEPLRLKAP
jgi:hypothetical protein